MAIVAQNFLSVRILRQVEGMAAQMQEIARVASAANLSAGTADAPPPLPTGSEAPAFVHPDTTGTERALADYRGRRTLLVFSSPTCRFCADYYLELERFASDPDFTDIQVVLLQLGTDPETNDRLRRDHELSFDILATPVETFRAYNVPATPFSLLLDEQGRVVEGDTLNTYREITRFVAS
jgi:peroxiredoxin